jgi:DNA topoisomerase IA
MPTALLICMENSAWSMSRDGNFVESFKKSFTLYVESGMEKKMEADIDILRNGFPETKNFSTEFYKFITEHYLRKFNFA